MEKIYSKYVKTKFSNINYKQCMLGIGIDVAYISNNNNNKKKRGSEFLSAVQ